jgi:hypothetical protein
MTTQRQRYICTLIEYVLSQTNSWLETAEVTRRVNELESAPALPADVREVRLKLHSLWRDGKARRTRSGRSYEWKWRP